MNKKIEKVLGITILSLIGLGLLAALLAFFNKVLKTDHAIFSISFVALLSGLFFESFRISESWLSVIKIFFGSFAFSFLSFLPGKHEGIYDFENHFNSWIYVFLIFFVIATLIDNYEKIVPQLTEGITLIQSLSFIYWVVDHELLNRNSLLLISVVIIGFIFSVFSVFSALTYFTLSKNTRFILSFWSSIMMLLFSIDNIYHIYKNENIETSLYLSKEAFTAIQFFFLGISSIYIAQNSLMFLRFIPTRGAFFNSEYFNGLYDLKREHVERYSEEQVHFGYSIIYIIVVLIVYWMNYKFHYLPRNTIIWACMVLLPILLSISFKKRRRR